MISNAQATPWQLRRVDSWQQFHDIVKPGRALLARLDDYGGSILVAGCQRSGTTAVTRLLKRAQGIADARFSSDDELDGALLLAGYVETSSSGKHCFQTTYLNDRFTEYFEHEHFKLVWVLREPAAVVRSMLRNWKRDALNRLFYACGRFHLEALPPERSTLDCWLGLSRLDKACVSYVAKTKQAFTLHRELGERMLIVDYDDLMLGKEALVPRICRFADLPYSPEMLTHLHGKSVANGKRLLRREAERVEAVCLPVYRRAMRLCALSTTNGRG